MKKLYLVLCLLLIPFVCQAGVVTSGSVTQANAKKSLVDGAAFIDISSEAITDQNDRDFSDGDIGNWTVTTSGSGTCTYSTASIGGVDDKQGLLTSNGDDYLAAKLSTDKTSISTNALYKITFNVYVPAENSIKNIKIYEYGMTNPVGNTYLKYQTLVGDTWTEVTADLLVGADNSGYIQISFDGDPADGDKLYFDDVSITKQSLSPYADADSGDHKHIFKLIDSAGKVAWGYVGASGGGETLGAEMHTDANAMSDPNGNEADATTGWTIYDLVTFESATEGTETGSYSIHALANDNVDNFYKDFTTVAGKIYKLSFDYKKAGGDDLRLSIGISIAGTQIYTQTGIDDAVFTNHTVYFPAIGVNTYISFVEGGANNNSEWYTDNLSLKQVTDCSTNGLHILSTKSGSVQNWADVESGFEANDGSGYTWEIKTIGRGASIW